MVNIDHAATKVTVGIATRQTQQSTGTRDLALPHLPLGFLLKGYLMPGFRHNLIGLGPLCDADCTVTFTRKAVIICDKHGTAVLTGWRETTGTRLWWIVLIPGEANLLSMTHYNKPATLATHSAYNKTLQILRDHNLTVDLTILENESRTEYKRVINKK